MTTPKKRRDEDVPLPPVPWSLFYGGRKPKRCRSFDVLTEGQARRRHRQADREARRKDDAR